MYAIRSYYGGMEHMALHLVKEQTVDAINANNINAIKATKYVTGTINGKMMQLANPRPFAFRRNNFVQHTLYEVIRALQSLQ